MQQKTRQAAEPEMPAAVAIVEFIAGTVGAALCGLAVAWAVASVRAPDRCSPTSPPSITCQP